MERMDLNAWVCIWYTPRYCCLKPTPSKPEIAFVGDKLSKQVRDSVCTGYPDVGECAKLSEWKRLPTKSIVLDDPILIKIRTVTVSECTCMPSRSYKFITSSMRTR